MELRKIQSANLRGKIIIVRVDHNVVKDGLIHDPYRIDATIGTLYHINARGGKIILMTHIGRPKNNKTSEIEISSKTSVLPIVNYLKNKLHIKIKVPDFQNKTKFGYTGIETSINHLIKDLKNDKLDLIYLPNTRWFSGEEGTEKEKDNLAYQLAGLADIYVNDAFGSWRAHASTKNIVKYLPSYAGYLLQKEIERLEKVYNPTNPFIAIVAGAKFNTKIYSLISLLEKVDYLILGGVIYNTYLCAKYGIKIKGVKQEDIITAKKFIEKSKKFEKKIIELPYIIESNLLEENSPNEIKIRDIRNFNSSTELNYILDISKKSFESSEIKKIFMNAKTIFVNAVMGFTPNFKEGTIALDQLIDKNKNATKLYGGGDTLQELKRLLPGLYIVALDNPNYHIFTGGGSVLKAIEEGSPYKISPIKMLLKN